MPREYRTKPLMVAAIKVPRIICMNEVSQEIKDLISESKGCVKNSAFHFLIVTTDDSAKIAREGDWIIRHHNGDYSVLTNEAFVELYEAI